MENYARTRSMPIGHKLFLVCDPMVNSPVTAINHRLAGGERGRTRWQLTVPRFQRTMLEGNPLSPNLNLQYPARTLFESVVVD